MIQKLWQGLKSLRRGDSARDWEFDERRELVRLRCHLEVDYTIGSKMYYGQIVDMSLGGMMLRCLQPPSIGSMTNVTYDLAAPETVEKTVCCRAQWCKFRESDFVYFIGLSYHSSEEILRRSWIKMMLKQLGFRPDKIFQRRKFVRANCFIAVRLEAQGLEAVDGLETVEGRLYNLAVKGTLIDAGAPLSANQTLTLEIGPHLALAPLQLEGRVISCQEKAGRYLLGVEFVKPSAKSDEQLAGYLRSLFEDESDG